MRPERGGHLLPTTRNRWSVAGPSLGERFRHSGNILVTPHGLSPLQAIFGESFKHTLNILTSSSIISFGDSSEETG